MDDYRQSVNPLSAWSRSASPGSPRPCRDPDTLELDVVHHFTVDDAGWFVRYRSFHDSARYAAAYRGTPPA